MLAALASSSSTDAALKAKNEDLQSQVKAKGLQIDMLTSCFLAKEQALEEENRKMKEELAKFKKELEEAKAGSSAQQRQEQELLTLFPFEIESIAPDTEEVEIELPKHEALTTLSRAEVELASLIEETLEPIQKECMEWEQRVLHSCHIVFPNAEEATKAYNKPLIPYALLKHELIKTKERLTIDCRKEELGGYQEISLDQWMTKANMQNQPKWRLGWFRRYPTSCTTYALAPRELRIDPLYCPVRRRRTWEAYHNHIKVYPSWLNYPLLPMPESRGEPTEEYILETLERVCEQFKGVPHLACQMMIRIASLIIACIKDFHDTIHMRAPWTKFLEGRQGLSWNLQTTPDPQIIMGMCARIQFMPGHFLNTFEDAFYTGFFEYQTKIFSPLVEDLGARLVAFQAMDLKNPIRDILEETKRERDYQRYKKVVEYINRMEKQH